MKVVFVFILVAQLLFVSAQTDSNFETNTGTCKDILQGYMTGQMTAALGSLQVENLRKEFQRILERQEQEIVLLMKDVAELKPNEENMNISTMYTRWGRATCPSHADTVYSGFVGGSHYTNKGGSAEPLCMPKDPEWGIYTDGTDGDKAFLYGAEYEFNTLTDSRKSLHDTDVLCAVCKVNRRSVTMMLPARRNCYDGWNKEYEGYLMAAHHTHNRGKFLCVDEKPEGLHGSQSNDNGYLLYAVEGICGSLPCPPYVNGRELTCVVCSF